MTAVARGYRRARRSAERPASGGGSGRRLSCVAEPARTGTFGGGLVVGVVEPAAGEGQTTAAQAAIEGVLEGLELLDAGCDPLPPRPAESGPVGPRRCSVGWEGVEECGDLLQAQPDVLGGGDERQATQGVSRISPLVAGTSGRADQTELVVVAQGGGAQSRAACGFPDGEFRGFGHAQHSLRTPA